MRKLKGFTLIELLIVVAIIAILAAIAIPNFLEAQVRSRVARVKSDMRSMSTAIEAYMIDTNFYPASYSGSKSINWGVAGGNAKYRMTFANVDALRITWPGPPPGWNGWGLYWLTLTTPTAYIGAISPDTFANEKNACLGFAAHEDKGWIMWSYGPDADESQGGGGAVGTANGGGQVGPWFELFVANGPRSAGALFPSFWGSETDYVYVGGGMKLNHHNWTNPEDPIENLKVTNPMNGSGTGVFLYDPSNGTNSAGDIISVAGTGPL